jgi:hypothetical protein
MQEKKDYEMWMMGQYIMQSLQATVCNGFIWRDKGQKPYEYPNTPFTQEKVKKEQNTNKESNEEIAVFEMKKRIKLLEQQGLRQSPK